MTESNQWLMFHSQSTVINIREVFKTLGLIEIGANFFLQTMDFYFKRKFFLTLPNAIVLIIKRYCQLKTVFNNSSIQNVKKFIANLKDQLATICLIFERYDNFYTKPYCFFFNFKNSASIKHPHPLHLCRSM